MVQSALAGREAAGLKAGDVIRAIDGKPVFFTGFLEVVRANPEQGAPSSRSTGPGARSTFPVTPRLEGKIGWIGIQHGRRVRDEEVRLFRARSGTA